GGWHASTSWSGGSRSGRRGRTRWRSQRNSRPLVSKRGRSRTSPTCTTTRSSRTAGTSATLSTPCSGGTRSRRTPCASRRWSRGFTPLRRGSASTPSTCCGSSSGWRPGSSRGSGTRGCSSSESALTPRRTRLRPASYPILHFRGGAHLRDEHVGRPRVRDLGRVGQVIRQLDRLVQEIERFANRDADLETLRDVEDPDARLTVLPVGTRRWVSGLLTIHIVLT